MAIKNPMPVYGLNNPYDMDRCGALHEPTGKTCERKFGHSRELQHSAASDDDFTGTLFWWDA